MIENQPQETWTQLIQTGFFPKIIGPVKKLVSFIILFIISLFLFSLQISCGHYSNIFNSWERAYGKYPVTIAILRLLLVSLSTESITETLIATAVCIMQTVFRTNDTWRYCNQKERDGFCKFLLFHLKLNYSKML